jgi:Protein of unknown function DUF262
MKYVNREMKIDQIIAYFNDKKFSLIPPFQRGTVWKLPMRKRLIQNMVQARPIPAIFLYKSSAGEQFNYNILDGKQRLESLILFVGNRRDAMKVNHIEHFFYGKPARENVNFAIEIDGEEMTFENLDDSLVRMFREYVIPVVEIEWDDEHVSMDEIVDLFVDINQEGVKVSRFDVVKALGRDPLFKQVFTMVALSKKKKNSAFYKPNISSFSFVLGNLNIVSRQSDTNAQVNIMWERLTEIALYARSHQHRAPAEILKAFINPEKKPNRKLNESQLERLRLAFGFLESAYRHVPGFTETKLATDQPQFYTLITTLLSTNMLERYPHPELKKRILAAAQIIDGKLPTPSSLKRSVGDYRVAAAKQTTHPARREKRQTILIRLIDSVEIR